MVKFKDIVTNSNYEVTTVNKEKFTVEMTCRLWAMVYIRFGRDVVAACEAMGRMLQSTPINLFLAEKIIAAGLALLEGDKPNDRIYTQEMLDDKLEEWYKEFLAGISW